MDQVVFSGARCARLANDKIELFAALDFGPRIIGLRLAGTDDNILKTYPEQYADIKPGEFQLFGGHRLWSAPEIPGFTDEPDGMPVEAVLEGGTLALAGALSASRLRKRISLTLDGPLVRVSHTLTNEGDAAVQAAPWALTVMEEGVIGLTPHAQFKPHSESLLPARPIVIWPYTKMDDPRVSWGSRLIRLEQRPGTDPFKFGAWIEEGFAGAWRNGAVFVKRFPVNTPGVLPDYGCNFETFTRFEMLEVESLGALGTIAPGQSVGHDEVWGLFPASAPPAGEDEARAWLDGFAAQVK